MTTFLSVMHELRMRQGNPSVREIARRTNGTISHTTVAEIFRGNTIASWRKVLAVVKGLGGDPKVILPLWRVARGDRPTLDPTLDDPLVVAVERLATAVEGLVAKLPESWPQSPHSGP